MSIEFVVDTEKFKYLEKLFLHGEHISNTTYDEIIKKYLKIDLSHESVENHMYLSPLKIFNLYNCLEEIFEIHEIKAILGCMYYITDLGRTRFKPLGKLIIKSENDLINKDKMKEITELYNKIMSVEINEKIAIRTQNKTESVSIFNMNRFINYITEMTFNFT